MKDIAFPSIQGEMFKCSRRSTLIEKMFAGYRDLMFFATTMSLLGVLAVGRLNIGSVGDGGRDEQLLFLETWLNLEVHPGLTHV